jgi:hypothetical protein
VLRLLATFGLCALLGCGHASEARSVASRALAVPEPPRAPEDRCAREAPSARGARVQIEPMPFDVASLPTVRAGGLLPSAAGPPLPGDRAPKDLTLRVLGSAFRPAQEPRPVELAVAAPFGWVEARPGTFECSPEAKSAQAPVPVRYIAVTPAWGEEVEYVIGDASLDPVTCTPSVAHRSVLRAPPLAGGMMYGMREQQSRGGPDRLVLIMPRALHLDAVGFDGDTVIDDLGTFFRVSVPLGPGGGGSMTVSFGLAELDAWLPEPAGSPRHVMRSGSSTLTVGVELTQAVGESQPVGLIYVERSSAPAEAFARRRLFECPEETASE